MVIGFPLVFESETTVGNVVEILEPLEEGHGDTTGIDVQIGNDEDVPVDEYLVGCGGRGAVGSLGDYFGLNPTSVLLGNDLLYGGRDEDIAGLVHEALALVGFGVRETDDAAVVEAVFLELLRVDTVRVDDRTVVFDDTDAGSAGTVQVTHCVQTHVTKALQNKSLAAPAWRRA